MLWENSIFPAHARAKVFFLMYKPMLANGYGPDILHLDEDASLITIIFNAGNAI
jgi:hypothetical protein